jgi:lipopolysaccharide transport system permease protein
LTTYSAQIYNMNPHAAHRISFIAMLNSLWGNRVLISQMSRREVLGRYKGSVMGLLWSFLNPLFMLVVYTFFFAVVFKSRWGAAPAGTEESKTLFAVLLFVGMIVHGLFAEVLNRAPNLILGNVNYVKKVVFPLEILPAISMGTALFHSLVSVGVLLMVFLATNGYLHWTLVFFPLILIPLVIFTIGLDIGFFRRVCSRCWPVYWVGHDSDVVFIARFLSRFRIARIHAPLDVGQPFDIHH